MLAKKESFLKFLHDDDETPNIKTKKLYPNIKSKNIENKKEKINEMILPKKSSCNNYSFQNFVYKIKNYDYNKKIKWESEIHKSSLKSDTNSNKIKLMELNRINFINPLLFLNKEYTKPNYQQHLFEQEIVHINDQIQIRNNKKNNILNNSKIYVEYLIEEKEKFELNKKILKYYLEYYCENKLEKIAPSLKEIENLENEVNLYYEKVHKGKEKINKLKKFNIDNTMKLILKKKKYQNLMKLYIILKNNILKCYKDIKNLKLKNMNFDYINYYDEMNKITNNIDSLEKNVNIVINRDNNEKLLLFEGIRNKLKKKKEKFNLKYISEINKLFDSKKSNILQLFYLFNIDNSIEPNNIANNNKNNNTNQSNLFVSKMIKNYKIRSKKLIFETINFHRKKEKMNTNSIMILNLNNQKLSDINNIQIEDSNIIICLKNILSKLKTHVDNFFYYFNLITKNPNINNNKEYNDLKEEIIQRKNEFYEIIDKHLSKLLKLFYNPKEKQSEEKILPKKYFLIIINLFCLVCKLLKYKFNLNYSKYLNLALKNYIIYYIKSENNNTLNRAFILLKNDFWEKAVLDKSYLNINNIKEKTPFYLKKFIDFLNEEEIGENENINNDINKDNIEDIFNYIINNENISDNNLININFEEVVDSFSNKKGIKFINKNNKIKILNKQLKYDCLYINNSSMCILRGIEEQISNLIIFEFLVYEIFTNLFNSVDIYIFVNFKMFLNDNKYLNNLLKNINIREIQNNLDNIEFWSDVISYQEKFSELKKFIIFSEKKFCEFYGLNKKFQNEEEKQIYMDNFIPKLKDILPMNNPINSLENPSLNDKNNDDINHDIKKDSNNNSDTNIKIKLLGALRSAVDDIGDGLSKAKDTAKNFLKSNQNINSVLIQEIEQKISENNFKYITIFISCISTFYKVLKRLINFTSKIELDFQKNQITERIFKYKKLIEQITYFFYMKITLNLIDFEKISPLIENSDWSPIPETGASQLFEQSFWVSKIINLFEIIVEIIFNKYGKIFEEKKLLKYFNILIKYIVSNIQDNFSKIKNCNDTGRSIMLKDIKFLKQGIENILKKYNYDKNIKTNELFDVVIQYINAWYYNTDELTKFIFDNHIQYKYFQSFLYSSPLLNHLTQEKKNNFINDMKQRYLLHFRKVISNMKY